MTLLVGQHSIGIIGSCNSFDWSDCGSRRACPRRSGRKAMSASASWNESLSTSPHSTSPQWSVNCSPAARALLRGPWKLRKSFWRGLPPRSTPTMYCSPFWCKSIARSTFPYASSTDLDLSIEMSNRGMSGSRQCCCCCKVVVVVVDLCCWHSRSPHSFVSFKVTKDGQYSVDIISFWRRYVVPFESFRSRSEF